MRDSNNSQNADDFDPVCDALQMRCRSVDFPELANLLAAFDELSERAQMRCRRRVRRICIEAQEQLAAQRNGGN
jgi:hypothetical protein